MKKLIRFFLVPVLMSLFHCVSFALAEDLKSINIDGPWKIDIVPLMENGKKLLPEDLQRYSGREFDDSGWAQIDDVTRNRDTSFSLPMSSQKITFLELAKDRLGFSSERFPHPLPTLTKFGGWVLMRTRIPLPQGFRGQNLKLIVKHGKNILFFAEGEFFHSTTEGESAFSTESILKQSVPVLMPALYTQNEDVALTIAIRRSDWPMDLSNVAITVTRDERLEVFKLFSEFFRVHMNLAFAVGAGLVAIYFLLMSQRSSRVLAFRLMSILALSDSVVLFYLSGLYDYLPLHPYYQKLTFIFSCSLINGAVLALIGHLFDSGKQSWLLRHSLLVSVCFGIVLCLFQTTNDASFNQVVPFLIIATFLFQMHSLYLLRKAARKALRQVLPVAAGIAIFSLTICESVLNFVFYYSEFLTFPIGTLFLLAGFVIYTNRHSAHEHAQLDSLRIDLEEQVTRRTEEFRRTNEKLQQSIDEIEKLEAEKVESVKLEELGHVAIRLGDRVSTPLMVTNLVIEEIDTFFEETSYGHENIAEALALCIRLAENIQLIKDEFSKLSKYKSYATADALERELGDFTNGESS